MRAGHAWCGLAALLGGLVYLNALDNAFVYDDHHTVVENRSIRNIGDVRAIALGAITRPIVNFSYAVDWALWGPDPFGFHVTNVLIHMVNVVLLFRLAKDLGMKDFAAFASAGAFAVHPMMTEAVGYISGRSEVLCATLFMLALVCGRRWLKTAGGTPTGERSTKWAVCTVALWFAALATKETAAMFPFVLLAHDWLASPAPGAWRRRLFAVHAPLVATAAAAGLVRLFILARVEYPGQVAVHWSYFLLDLDVIRRYLSMIALPTGQAIFHEVSPVGLFDFRALLSAAVVGSTLGVSWILRRRDWVVPFGAMWFLLALVPSAVMVALDQGEPMAEHRVYLAGCGGFLAIGALIGQLDERARRANPSWHPAAPVLVALLLASFGAGTLVRNAVWARPVTLWRESVELAPTHFRPRLLLGEALQDEGRRDEALVQYRTAIRLRPTDPAGYVKVGQCLAELGRWDEARRYFSKALEIDPRYVAAHHGLTVLHEIESHFAAARR